MKSILILLIAALCIQAAIVDYEDQMSFQNIDPTIPTTPVNFDEEQQLPSTPVNEEDILPVDLPSVFEDDQNVVDETTNQPEEHKKKERKHDGKPHKNREDRPERPEGEKKDHEGDHKEGERKNRGGKHEKPDRPDRPDRPERPDDERRPPHNKKDKKRFEEERQGKHGQESDDNKPENLRGQSTLQQQQTPSSPGDIHMNFKKGGSKLKKAFKKLPKGVRIATIVCSSLLALFILVKLVKCCKRRRQERKARREALRQQYLEQQATQQFLNNSNNPTEQFLPVQSGVAIGQPIPQQAAPIQVPAAAPAAQALNYSYPPLTNTLIAQQQQYIQLQQQQQQQQHQQRVVPVHVQQLPQQYYAIPQGQAVVVPNPAVHPVLVNAQSYMTVEAPQLNINRSESNNSNSERASFEMVDTNNARRQQYPVLHQQQLKNPYAYQQF